MKNKLTVVVGLGLVLAALVVFWKRLQPAGSSARTAADQDAAVARALATANPQAAGVITSNFSTLPAAMAGDAALASPATATAGDPVPLGFTNLAPTTVLENVRTVIRNYGARFGGNPVGNNAEITRALGGENPGQVNYLNPEAGLRVNSAGELVDVWGTPLFFHQLSGRVMEIHSAGPDGKLWTADDLVTE